MTDQEAPLSETPEEEFRNSIAALGYPLVRDRVPPWEQRADGLRSNEYIATEGIGAPDPDEYQQWLESLEQRQSPSEKDAESSKLPARPEPPVQSDRIG